MGDIHPLVSFVIATHNRCEVVRDTLARIDRSGLARRDYELIVVDNASTDGTADAVTPLADHVLRLGRNAGSCAKAYGMARATGRYVVFLDDDAYPREGMAARMIEHFEGNPDLAAAGFAVHLSGGGWEASALPGVFVGCGVGFLADALRQVGGLDRSFFMQAEEYDLCFRLVAAGWQVRVFDDLIVEHLKTARARRNSRTVYYDVRNNLRVVARYLPKPYYDIYRQDWLQRYRWLALHGGYLWAFDRGARAGRWRGLWERYSRRPSRLPPAALEEFFSWEYVARRMSSLARSGVRRVVLAELGKNVYAFYRAARRAGVTVCAIGDDRCGGRGRWYRGLPVVPMGEALSLDAEAVVVAQTAGVHAAGTCRRVRRQTDLAVHVWFGASEGLGKDDSRSSGEPALADVT